MNIFELCIVTLTAGYLLFMSVMCVPGDNAKSRFYFRGLPLLICLLCWPIIYARWAEVLS